jgi:general secretion pathway protein D
MRAATRAAAAALVLATGLLLAGCAAQWAYRKGNSEARKGNWDMAVARYTKALQKDPDNIGYKIALENARVRASRQHYDQARKHLAAEELERAADELSIAVKYDESNKSAAEDLVLVRDRIRRLEEEKARLSEFEAMKQRAQLRVPVPQLADAARAGIPISLNFTETSLEKVFQTMGKLTGVNVLMDPDFRDKRVNVNLTGVTFEQALDQLTRMNGLFYKVLDQNSIIIVNETPQKRRRYDDEVVRTFYLQNAETDDVLNQIRTVAGIQKAVANKALAAVTVLATPEKVAIAERIVEANDKTKGEVMVEVQILEVNRSRMKQYGIELSNYSASLTLSPTGAQGEVSDGSLNIRAHLLSSLNLSDYVVNIPSTVLTRFLQTDSTTKLLAAPKLRAAEGKKTELKIVSQIPVPTTTFQSTTTGSATFTPIQQVQYKDVGVVLGLTPKISPGGEVVLEVEAEFSLVGENRAVGDNQVLPTFLTRNLKGMLRLRDGSTSLIGGLIQGRDAASLSGPLGLASVPLIGSVFGSRSRTREDQEIVISITPHIVRAPKLTEEDLAPLLVGPDEARKVPGARPPLFGPTPSPQPSPPPAPKAPPETTGAALPTPPPAAPAPSRPAPSPPPTPRIEIPPPMAPPSEQAPAAPEPMPATVPIPAPASPSPTPTPPPGTERTQAPPRAQALMARFTPPQIMPKTGETGSFSIVLLGAENVTAIEAVLSWDPAALEVTDAAAGALLTLDGTAVNVQRQLEYGKARVKFTRPKGVSGSGAVVTLTVKALKAGFGLVNLDGLTVTTPERDESAYVAGQGRVLVTQ